MDNQPETLNKRIFETARALDNIFRCSRLSVLHRQSVSEHSFHVAFLGFLASADMKMNGIPHDELKLLKLCLLHDFEEGMTGDIVNPVKRHNPQMEAACHFTAQAMFDDMLKEMPGCDANFDVWKELKHLEDQDCIEKRVMKLLDMLEFVISQHREMKLGNGTSEKQYLLGSSYTITIFNRLAESGVHLPSIWEIFLLVAPEKIFA